MMHFHKFINRVKYAEITDITITNEDILAIVLEEFRRKLVLISSLVLGTSSLQ